jgi:hypothetical protein
MRSLISQTQTRYASPKERAEQSRVQTRNLKHQSVRAHAASDPLRCGLQSLGVILEVKMIILRVEISVIDARRLPCLRSVAVHTASPNWRQDHSDKPQNMIETSSFQPWSFLCPIRRRLTHYRAGECI